MVREPQSDRSRPPVYWPRAILHIDMNAFFASVEQRDFPELRGRPIGITNGEVGSTLITCSYEARACGVHTGMRLKEARVLCPAIIQRPARPRVYAAVSTAIMHALHDITPDVEVFSVDEAFLDVTHCQRLHGTPERMAHMARERVHAASGGLPCSIGIAPDKSTAKVASDLEKPNGFVVIRPGEARARLDPLPADNICGIGPRIRAFLERYGVRTCGDVARLPMAVLAGRYGVVGKHLWLMCQGIDPTPVVTGVPPPRSVGHGKVLPPGTRDRETAELYFLHMCVKVAARLRRYGLMATRLYLGARRADGEVLHLEADMPRGFPDAQRFYALARAFLDRCPRGVAITHVQVTATRVVDTTGQLDLFDAQDARLCARLGAQDRINRRYGEFAVAPARLLARSKMPNVIAPAWRPEGHRQHIPDV